MDVDEFDLVNKLSPASRWKSNPSFWSTL